MWEFPNSLGFDGLRGGRRCRRRTQRHCRHRPHPPLPEVWRRFPTPGEENPGFPNSLGFDGFEGSLLQQVVDVVVVDLDVGHEDAVDVVLVHLLRPAVILDVDHVGKFGIQLSPAGNKGMGMEFPGARTCQGRSAGSGWGNAQYWAKFWFLGCPVHNQELEFHDPAEEIPWFYGKSSKLNFAGFLLQAEAVQSWLNRFSPGLTGTKPG